MKGAVEGANLSYIIATMMMNALINNLFSPLIFCGFFFTIVYCKNSGINKKNSVALDNELSSLSDYPEIWYQIHSNNDLREWPQLLRKGAIHFKVDPHYFPGCSEAGSCFILNHDSPQESVSYNTTDDLVSYLHSLEFQAQRGDKSIQIAFCFKSAPDKCDEASDEFSDWLSLVDQLHQVLTDNPPQGVQFLLDGDGKPISCLVGRWNPWLSVWIEPEPAEAFYSNSIEVIFSQ